MIPKVFGVAVQVQAFAIATFPRTLVTTHLWVTKVSFCYICELGLIVNDDGPVETNIPCDVDIVDMSGAHLGQV